MLTRRVLWLAAAALLVVTAWSAADGAPTPTPGNGRSISVAASDVSTGDSAARYGGPEGARSLADLSAPAVVVIGEGVSLEAVADDIARFSLSVSEVLHVDPTRPEIIPPDLGLNSSWASVSSVWGAGFDVTSLQPGLSSDEIVAFLGFFPADYVERTGLPSVFPIIELMRLEGARLTPIGPYGESLSAELDLLRGETGLPDIEIVRRLSSELREKETESEGGPVAQDTPLLDILRPPPPSLVDQWRALPAEQRMTFNAPDAIKAELAESMLIIDLDREAIAAGYVVGVMSDAGWAGAMTLDVANDSAWPVLLDPDSSIRVVIAREGFGAESMVTVAEMPPEEWTTGYAIHVVITEGLLNAAVVDAGGLPPSSSVVSVVDEAEARALIRAQHAGVFVPAVGPDELHESELAPPVEGD